MAILSLLTTSQLQEFYSLEEKPIRIGRNEACDVILPDASVSRDHAEISKTDNGYSLKDLDSKNGTRVNGKQISEVFLHHGDMVHFGDIIARFWEYMPEDQNPFPAESESTIFMSRRELTDASKQLGFLYQLTDAAAEMESEDRLISLALEILGANLDCENAYLGFYDEDLTQITRAYFRPFKENNKHPFALSRTILKKSLESGKGLLVSDTRTDEQLKAAGSVREVGIRSVLCVPIIVANATLGIVYADTRSRVRPFTRDDLEFSSAFGSLLGSLLKNMRSISELKRRNQELSAGVTGSGLIGEAPVMADLRQTLERYASKGDSSVLIVGETGTGKELAAKIIHLFSSRPDERFLKVNCGAIPPGLMESELFGHKKGAYTHASSNRRGLFELADHGTLFLDEIGEMPRELQVKLLRVLQEGEVWPVGAEKPIQVDVRIVAATNRDLQKMVREGTFREDLFYRLNVLPVLMPPLRDHAEDIPLIARRFLGRLKEKITTSVLEISPAAMQRLSAYPWPGNVRELENVLERACTICDQAEIRPEHLVGLDPEDAESDSEEPPQVLDKGRLDADIENLEKVRIADSLDRHRWNRSRAAVELGITRKTLLAKMRKYGLQ